MVIRLTPSLLGLGAARAIAVPAQAAQLRAYAGMVADNADGTGSIFACTTSGPTIGNGWFAGVAMPPRASVAAIWLAALMTMSRRQAP